MKLTLLVLSAALANAATYTETVDLQNAGRYAVLAKSGISTDDARIEGDIAVSPIAATAMTGFGLKMEEYGMHSTSSLVSGKCFGADHAVPSPGLLTQSVIQMQEAYTKASLRTTSDSSRINLKGGKIGGETLTPGVYSFNTAINIYSNVVFDGDEDDVFIIQTTGVLTIAADTYVQLTGKVQAKNIFWVVAGNAELGARSIMQGVLLVKTDVAMLAGSALIGRVLSQTAVNLMKGAKVTEARVDVTVPPAEDWINLEEACGYAVLSEAGTTGGALSKINGDMGVSPAAASYNTGFGESLDAGGVWATSASVNGKMYAADYAGATPATLTKAVIAWQAAYTNAAGRANLDESRINLGGGNIGGYILTPGVYTFKIAVQIQKDVTFDGGPDDVFIIQSTGVLSSAAGAKVILTGGAQAKNIIWQFADYVMLLPDTEFHGIIMTWSYAALQARATVNGAVFAKTAVTLDQNIITGGAAGNCAAPTNYVEPSKTEDKAVAEKENSVDIGKAKDYAVLAKESVTTMSTSTITGNIAVSGTKDTVIGFGLTLDIKGKFATASQLSGKIFASDMEFPVPDELKDAMKDMLAAYLDAVGRINWDDARINLGSGDIGGLVLTPGVYTFTVSLDIPKDITINGGPNDIFIIQVNGPLTVWDDTEVLLAGGVDPNNIIWQVAGPVTVGSDSSMQGVIMAEDDVLFKGGSQLEGRIMGQKKVTLQMMVLGTEEAFCS
jgi:hypothetical protein